MSVVTIKKVRPTSPGVRWRRKIMFNKVNRTKQKKFCYTKKWHAGRVVSGRVAFKFFSKKKYKKKITLNLVKLDARTTFVSKTFSFNFNNRKPYVLFWVKGGGSFILPATTTNLPGKVYTTWSLLIPTYQRGLTGVPVELRLIPFYMRICNIADMPFRKYKYATASGAYATKIRATKKEKNIKIIMPSGQFKLIAPDSLVISGLTLQYWLHKQVYGKAGIPKQQGKKQSVRGIAMNSVDHPHGGKANSVQPEKSPWGWVTKKSH